MDGDIAPWLLSRGKSRKTRLESAASSQSEEDLDDHIKRKSSLSKNSYHSKSEKIVSELSKLTDPNESDEDRALESDSGSFSREMSQSQRTSKSQKTLSRRESRMRSSRRSSHPEGGESEVSMSQDENQISARDKSQLSKRDKSQMSGRDASQLSNGEKSQMSHRDASRISNRDKSRTSEMGKSKMSTRDKSMLSGEGVIPTQQDQSLSQDEEEQDRGISKAPSRRSSRGFISNKESRQSTHQSLRKSRISDKSQASDKQSRQSTHFSFKPNEDHSSDEEEEIEEDLMQGSRGPKNCSKMTSRKTTMSTRTEEEMLNLGDKEYSDEEFEENEERMAQGFEFEDKMVSRARSQPMKTGYKEDIEESRNVDTAPGEMRRRSSIRMQRRDSEV